MRILAIIALSFVLAQSLQAQGTLRFTAEANGRGAVPPNNSIDSAGGTFYLSQNIFSGEISFLTTSTAGGSLLAIRDGGGAVQFIPDRIEWEDVGGPFGFGYVFWEERPLNGAQIDDSLAGNWYLVVSNDQFPNGELRGQLQLVPEPSVAATLGLGLIALFGFLRRTKRCKVSCGLKGVILVRQTLGRRRT